MGSKVDVHARGEKETFLKPTEWRNLKETLLPGSDQKDANGQWTISPGIKNVKHVFIFIQKVANLNAATTNPYVFHTFALDGGAKLSTCRLQYGATFYPETDYAEEDQIRIRRDLID